LECPRSDGENVEHDGGIVTCWCSIGFDRFDKDSLSKDWDIDAYCQDPEWKDVMVLWKSRQLHASVREVEDGLDAENSPFLKLSDIY
jgi:hypothetical protein